MSRLDTIAGEIAAKVRESSEVAARAAAVAAAEFAVERTGLNEQHVTLALEALRRGSLDSNGDLRTALEAVVTELDERYWELQDEDSPGPPAQDGLKYFGQARAASAVYFAGDADSRLAATEAIYEASAVVDDIGELSSLIMSTLLET